jgi:hypothetical protein
MRPSLSPCVTFRNNMIFLRWTVNPTAKPKLKDHPLSAVRDCLLNIVTYSGFVWVIITGSGLDDWICWHFFTITPIVTAHSQLTAQDSLHSLLDLECLLFPCDELRTKNSFRLNWMKNDNSAEPNRDHHLQQLVFILSAVRCHGNVCLVVRCRGDVCFWNVA